jgi:hypothetical protein
MAYEIRENSGSVFKNERKREGKKDADYTGSINVDGVEYWINGWLKKSEGKPSWLSLSVSPKEKKAQSSQKPKVDDFDDLDFDEEDEIPF